MGAAVLVSPVGLCEIPSRLDEPRRHDEGAGRASVQVRAMRYQGLGVEVPAPDRDSTRTRRHPARLEGLLSADR